MVPDLAHMRKAGALQQGRGGIFTFTAVQEDWCWGAKPGQTKPVMCWAHLPEDQQLFLQPRASSEPAWSSLGNVTTLIPWGAPEGKAGVTGTKPQPL